MRDTHCASRNGCACRRIRKDPILSAERRRTAEPLRRAWESAMATERVLITGGASGIGRATPERCRADGYEPVILDREGDGIRADLSSAADTARALEAALRGGPITRLVNNVGV